MTVNTAPGNRTRGHQRIYIAKIDGTTAGATGYDAVDDPGDGFRIVILGYALHANVANLIVTIESANGDDMGVVMVGTSSAITCWVETGICSANASEKVTFTHNVAARCTGWVWYIKEAA